MEREILFRGKDCRTGDWVEGDYTRYSKIMGYITANFIENEVHEVDARTVGQYTGLKDNNGTRIFEGDIVYILRDDERGIVSWDSDGACFEVVIDNISTTFRDNWFGHDLEVIGNVHDDPELMEVEYGKENP